MPLTTFCSARGTGGCSLRFKPEAPITGLCLVAPFCDFPNKLSCIRSSEAISAEGGDRSYPRNEWLFYNSELCPPACRGPSRWLLEGYSRNIVLAPDRFTDMNSSEIVEAKIERVRQLVSFEGKLNTKTETCKIVNGAMVHGLILNQ